MSFIDTFRQFGQKLINRLRNTSTDNIIWIVNIIPNIAGFSIRRDKIAAPYWILHISLLFYVYGVGCVVYQVNTAISADDFIKSHVNVSLLILIFNISYWWLSKRHLLLETLKLVYESDKDSSSSDILRKKYTKMLLRIKMIVLTFYLCNYTNAALVYLPHRTSIENDYNMATCVGLEPLTSSPNREICLTILFVQECTIMVAVLNYQVLLLFFIAHTAASYNILSEELMAFNKFTDQETNQLLVKQRLPYLIIRHVRILSTVDKLKRLYSLPIGVDFGSNAFCLSLLFYMPLLQLMKYMPIIVYCFLTFFLYCFLCQKLTNAAEVFERAVYSCGWENFGLKEKKLIFVMLRQAQKPVILLAADIIPVNMYTFATTLQFMFKFVTVVKF